MNFPSWLIYALAYPKTAIALCSIAVALALYGVWMVTK